MHITYQVWKPSLELVNFPRGQTLPVVWLLESNECLPPFQNPGGPPTLLMLVPPTSALVAFILFENITIFLSGNIHWRITELILRELKAVLKVKWKYSGVCLWQITWFICSEPTFPCFLDYFRKADSLQPPQVLAATTGRWKHCAEKPIAWAFHVHFRHVHHPPTPQLSLICKTCTSPKREHINRNSKFWKPSGSMSFWDAIQLHVPCMLVSVRFGHFAACGQDHGPYNWPHHQWIWSGPPWPLM